MAHTIIHSHTIKLEDGAEDISSAIRYLENHLSRDEADVYFSQAKSKGEADFEDHHGSNFTLKYRGDGIYKIEKR